MAASNVDAHLEINPENSIEFELKEAEATPKVSMTLTHPDKDSGPVAFKVKTTQPRRYLVRPNQGLIQPGKSETVQILLVEKDKTQLMAAFQKLGAAALDHCKDKFLVQSVAVTATEAESLQEYDQLTNLWSSVQGGSNTAVANKKLHVKHRVVGDAGGASLPGMDHHNNGGGGAKQPSMPVADMSADQCAAELTTLRKKYDELVHFSVNLTAERDMLNNTLEQTKRDLNRATKNTNQAMRNPQAGSVAAPRSGISPLIWVVLLILCFLIGAKLQSMGKLEEVPYLGEVFKDEL